MSELLPIILPPLVLAIVIFLVKFGEKTERVKNDLEASKALLEQKAKDEKTQAILNDELSTKRQSIRGLLLRKGNSD